MMSKFMLPLVAFALLVGMFVVGLNLDPSRIPSPLLQHAAPEFAIPSLHDANVLVGSASYANQVALVNIWATWCPGCRQEHGFLLELAAEGTIPIFGLNWRDDRVEALRWLETLGDPYVASGYDVDGRVGIDWGAYGAPETFLIDSNGIVIHKHIAPLTREIWEHDFVPLIGANKAE
ncbi:MAG: DsbE family thiol:disulfide interchange protein [Proteobacteria bacterium]|nr:DsbE family thiol:disulfide interchange protein [Pseudomonadota bacterium]MDA1063912.1 DsbE family thiol:disulfide interchange protein [Pseudomonadota bacterium]